MTTYINDDGSITANAAPAMTTEPNVAEIAGKLSEAQRAILVDLGMDRVFHPHRYKGGWGALWQMWRGPFAALIASDGPRTFALTEKGAALRDHLLRGGE